MGVARGTAPFLPRYRAYAIAISATVFLTVLVFVVIMEATRR